MSNTQVPAKNMFTAVVACIGATALSALLAGCDINLPPVDEPPDDEPAITSIEPQSEAPGQLVQISGDNFGPLREGLFEIRFNGAPGTIIEPIIDHTEEYEGGRIRAFSVIVPPQATTGPITMILPGLDDPRIPIEIVSDLIFVLIPLEIVILPPIAVPCPITFRRLRPPNFISEVADSKDVVMADFDGDGDLDAFIPQTSTTTDTLYRNDGTDIVGNPFITVLDNQVTNDVSPKRQYGAAGADLDGDGDIDVVPSGHSPQGEPSRIRLLVNDGNGEFTDEADLRIDRLTDITGPKFGWDDVKFGDVDGDGDLDIALANRCSPSACGVGGADERSALLINRGPGANLGMFTAVKDAFGEPASEVHHDVLFCDLNNDNLPDVVLSQDMRGSGMQPLRVLLNQFSPTVGALTFVDASSRLFPNPAAHSEHLGCQDFNNDGLMDLHIGNFLRSDKDVTTERSREDMIYLNASVDTNMNGVIELSEIVLNMVANPESGGVLLQGFDALTYSAGYGDFDNDGDVDILLGAMAPDPTKKGPFLMCNDGAGVFTNCSLPNTYWRDLTNTVFDHFNPTSPGVGDLNGDGLLDIVWGMGDGMNGFALEANRIYIQGEPTSICALLGFIPCRVIVDEFFIPGEITLEFEVPEEIIVTPIPRCCLAKFDCPGCGGPFGLCENFYNIVFDFQKAQLDPQVLRIRLLDFDGKEVADERLLADGRIALTFQPEQFKEGGVDTELLLAFELTTEQRIGEPFSIPMALEVTSEPLLGQSEVAIENIFRRGVDVNDRR